MATIPMQPGATPDAEDLQDGGAAEAQEQGDGSYTISIRVAADKSLSVCVEPGTDQDEDDGMSQYVPATNIKEALTTALEIFKADGQMPSEGDNADFESGYADRGGSSPAM